MKKNTVLCCTLLVLTLSLILTPLTTNAAVPEVQATPVDIGNNNDYGGGDWGGGGDYGGGGYGGGFIFWGDSDDSDGDGGGGAAIGFIIAIAVIAFVVISRLKHPHATHNTAGRAGTMNAPSVVADQTQPITTHIQQEDPLFDKEKFLSWTKEVFVTLQMAWSERDTEKLRLFEKEELFRQHKTQLEEYTRMGRKNILERIAVKNAYFHKYESDAEYEYLTCFVASRMNDYIIDEKTGQVVKGDPQTQYFLDYFLTFSRRKGILTDPARTNLMSEKCPHCGAPIELISAGKCEYCNHIITTDEHDWALCRFDGVPRGYNQPGGVFGG